MVFYLVLVVVALVTESAAIDLGVVLYVVVFGAMGVAIGGGRILCGFSFAWLDNLEGDQTLCESIHLEVATRPATYKQMLCA